MPASLDIVVPNPRLQRTAFSHIKVYRSPAENGTYVEVTGATTRIPLTSSISYTFHDPTGSDDPDAPSWYRISYLNATTRAESGLGPATPGAQDPAEDIISVNELKENFLFSVDLTGDDGTPYPDSMFRFYIRSAVAWLEQRLDIPLRRKVIAGEQHDYFDGQFQKHQLIQLDHYPVLAVNAVRVLYPSQPSSARTYPREWVQVKERGLISIVPGSGALALSFFGGGGLLLPAWFGGGHRALPHIYEVDYVAGFERGRVPANIRELAGKIAALGPLNIAGDLVAGAGIQAQSVGIDGLSQSLTTTNSSTNAGFGARIIQYRKEIAEQLPILYSYYHGVKITVG